MSNSVRYEAVSVTIQEMYYRQPTIEVPRHMVWVCGACGKTSRTRYGWNKSGKSVADPGWDSSCRCCSVLCYKNRSERNS